jgi:hypothetical protein
MLTQLLILLGLLGGALPQAPVSRWLPEKSNPRLWREMRAAFQPELFPDTTKTKDRYPRSLSRIACVSDVCLVIIRVDERAPGFAVEWFDVFSYDRTSHTKTPIKETTRGSFGNWKVDKWATFAPQTPELVFTYQTCFECEPEFLLSSFYFDAASRTWAKRKWSSEYDEILIESYPPDGATQCLYRIADFTGDGNADIAVWCQELSDDRPPKPIEEKITLYTVSGGQAREQIPDAVQARSLKRALCVGNASHAFCRRRR